MEWPRIKTLIIWMLLLINGFLLALVGVQQYQVSHYRRSALTQAVAVLEQGGIAVDAHPLTDAPPSLTAERSSGSADALARALLGDGLTHEDQGGGLHRYTAPSGEIAFRSGGILSVRFFDAAAPDPDLEKHAQALLTTTMGLQGELWSVRREDSVSTLTFYQLWKGSPIFTCPIILEYDGQQLLSLQGTLLLSSGSQSPDGRATLDLPTALIRFRGGILSSGDVCSSITSFRPGYRTSAAFGSSVTLSPVWHVSTNTAEYYLDALTGALTRIT